MDKINENSSLINSSQAENVESATEDVRTISTESKSKTIPVQKSAIPASSKKFEESFQKVLQNKN